MLGEDTQTLSFRGRRSRNKVSVGEPAEGSLSFLHPHPVYRIVPSLRDGVEARIVFNRLDAVRVFGVGPLGAPRSGGSSEVASRLELSSENSARRLTPWSACARAASDSIEKSHNSFRWISWHEQR